MIRVMRNPIFAYATAKVYRCANVGYFATDVSATEISARTFRPSKMLKVDVSAKTITLCIFE